MRDSVMKNFFLVFTLLCIGSIDASNIESEMKIFDLHQQSINLSNIDTVAISLQELPHTCQYKLDLSDNYIDDDSLDTLLDTIETENLSEHIQILDLTNNKITLHSLLRLLSLITLDTFDWLVVPINCLDMSDMRIFMTRLKEKARDVAVTKGKSSSETLFNQWIEKVIWLPKMFNFSAILPEAQKSAHIRYYQR